MSQQSPDRDNVKQSEYSALDALLRIGGSGGQRDSTKKISEQHELPTNSALGNYSSTTLTGLSNLLPISPQDTRMILPRGVGPANISAQLVAALGQQYASPGLPLGPAILQENVSSLEGENKASYQKAQDSINREKVEAALRSKPQRGRKRDDLSDKERLELTRTRNREHAKSTRIRKKARYQELLDCEERLKKVHAHRDLIALRCQSVQKFLSFRKAMLLNSNHENEENHSAITDASHPPLLADIVESVHDFQFRIAGDVTDNEEVSWLSRMRLWDRTLISRLIQNYGDGIQSSLNYDIVGGIDGIGVSKDGNALARVNLKAKKDGVNTVLSGVLMVKFAGEHSSRLCSADWLTIEDSSSVSRSRKQTSNSDKSKELSSASPESLGSQLVHPSVVSLDVYKAAESEDSNNEPGMNLEAERL